MLRTCRVCGLQAHTEEDLKPFRKDKRCKHGRQNLCLSCETEHDKQRYIKNREHMIERSRQWYSENKGQKAKTNKQWRTKNLDRRRAFQAKRRASKFQATPTWADLETIQAYYTEAQRLSELTAIPFHVDHIIPLQSEFVCGLHCEDNLQLLPAHENLSKSNSLVDL